jgi:hypothetical protein
MKTIKNITITVLILLTISSCEDVLDTAPQGVLAEGLSSESVVDGLITAAYHGLSANVTDVRHAFVGPSSNWVMDVRSDDAYTGGEGAASLEYAGVPQMERASIFPSDVDGDQLHVPLNKWRNNLIAIARVNLAIRNIRELESENYPKSERIAEMRLLRAHFHFDLKRNFDMIPYIMEYDDPSEKSNSEFSSDQLWDLIEEDLKAAYDSLPETYDTDIARVNKYTAAAYLCKVHVERENWSDAITMADYVISGPFDLLGEFEDLATIEEENGLETVFAFQYSRGNVQLDGDIFPNHSWSDLLNTPRGPYSGDGFYLGSQNLANAFRTDANGLPMLEDFNDEVVGGSTYSGNLDPRIDFTFGRVGIPWKDAGVYDATWIRNPTFYPEGRSSKKHVLSPNDPNINPANTGPHSASGLNYQYIRFSEVLLWKAEALIESGGDLNEARQLINRVRQRAMNSTYVQKLDGSGDAANYNISLYPGSGWTQDYARKALRFERRLELAMEGHRYYDLVRWGVVEEVMNDYFSVEVTRAPHLENEDLTFPAGEEYLPIPQEEIDLAPELYTQNR